MFIYIIHIKKKIKYFNTRLAFTTYLKYFLKYFLRLLPNLFLANFDVVMVTIRKLNEHPGLKSVTSRVKQVVAGRYIEVHRRKSVVKGRWSLYIRVAYKCGYGR